jgi:hypothetical protein
LLALAGTFVSVGVPINSGSISNPVVVATEALGGTRQANVSNASQ